jgi:hypothetical protein
MTFFGQQRYNPCLRILPASLRNSASLYSRELTQHLVDAVMVAAQMPMLISVDAVAARPRYVAMDVEYVGAKTSVSLGKSLFSVSRVPKACTDMYMMHNMIAAACTAGAYGIKPQANLLVFAPSTETLYQTPSPQRPQSSIGGMLLSELEAWKKRRLAAPTPAFVKVLMKLFFAAAPADLDKMQAALCAKTPKSQDPGKQPNVLYQATLASAIPKKKSAIAFRIVVGGEDQPVTVLRKVGAKISRAEIVPACIYTHPDFPTVTVVKIKTLFQIK